MSDWKSIPLEAQRALAMQTRTSAEMMLCEALNKEYQAYEVQWPIGPYFVDVAFVGNKVYHPMAVEVDGPYHLTPEQQRKDMDRTAYLKRCGWAILRFTNEDVSHNLGKCLRRIWCFRQELKTPEFIAECEARRKLLAPILEKLRREQMA